MNMLSKGATLAGASALLLGGALALSSAQVVSGETAGPDLSKITCAKPTYCFEGNNTKAGPGVEGVSASGDGLEGVSGSRYGVFGKSDQLKGIGVSGASSDGVGVAGDSSKGIGVTGFSKANYGVLGTSTNKIGVYGVSTKYVGVAGTSNTGTGVVGDSTNSYGVDGYSSNNAAGFFENDASFAYTLYAQNDADGAPLIAMAYNAGQEVGAFWVDAGGNGYFSGSVFTMQAPINDQQTRRSGHVGTFSAQSTRATIEDTGTARLVNGESAVRFDPAFAGTLDISRGYQVFVTPDGETRGLYIAAKYEGGFMVRENERGRSSVDFDYRVVAHPIGSSDARLPRLNLKPPQVSGPRPPRLH
ncbi:MAG TPA: hypothetical protein VMT95_04925 [Candidatus Binatia bacterium]|nr:hypothetical protein [Candidatus Binatia bacterium]